jgi:hypothetical protein
MKTKVTKQIEKTNGDENLTLRQAGEKTESVKSALLSSLAAAKNDAVGDLIFEAHNDLLPELFEGWISSPECTMMEPHIRAGLFGRYTALQRLLSDIDEILDRLPLDILISCR